MVHDLIRVLNSLTLLILVFWCFKMNRRVKDLEYLAKFIRGNPRQDD